MLPEERWVEVEPEVLPPVLESVSNDEENKEEEGDDTEPTPEPFSLSKSEYRRALLKFDAHFKRVAKTEGYRDLFLIEPKGEIAPPMLDGGFFLIEARERTKAPPGCDASVLIDSNEGTRAPMPDAWAPFS